MNKSIYLRVIKIAIGGYLAFILADFLKVEYAISASIITLLTIQDTKKETIVVAIRRFASFILAMILAFLIFNTLGNQPIVYGIFIFIFCLLCYKLKFQDGIASSLVLTTHIYLLNEISLSILLNESMLMIIGVSIGITLNLIMPKNIEDIKNNQQRIEITIKQILDDLSLLITKPTYKTDISNSLIKLDVILKETKKQSIENSNNTLQADTSYYLSYVQMRKDQSLVLKHINNQMSSLEIPIKQANIISDFLKEISDSLHESNNAIRLLDKLNKLFKTLEQDELPKTRIEFEHRALLFSLINDLETFLQIKKDFIEELSNIEIQRYHNKI